jgi:hypothetical protein
MVVGFTTMYAIIRKTSKKSVTTNGKTKKKLPTTNGKTSTDLYCHWLMKSEPESRFEKGSLSFFFYFV